MPSGNWKPFYLGLNMLNRFKCYKNLNICYENIESTHLAEIHHYIKQQIRFNFLFNGYSDHELLGRRFENKNSTVCATYRPT